MPSASAYKLRRISCILPFFMGLVYLRDLKRHHRWKEKGHRNALSLVVAMCLGRELRGRMRACAKIVIGCVGTSENQVGFTRVYGGRLSLSLSLQAP